MPAASGTGCELGHDPFQVVYATEVLYDDTLDSQVLAPYLCDEFGVMAPLDIDPAGPGDPGPCTGHRDRAGRRYARGGRRRASRRSEDHRAAFE